MEKKKRLRRHWGRCMLDLMLTVPTLIVLAPIMAIIALLVRVKIGRPVIFRQQRPGLHGKPFILYKLRTMTNARDAQGNLLSDKQRIARVGRLFRKTSLDELPELWNVIKGDMRLVGPRPLLIEYLNRYTPEQARRHEVKPGVTGWAQINGRNAITWEEKFKYDVWYVDNKCLWLDFKIIFMTIIKVIKREGISHPGQTTMEEFKGTKN